MYHLRGEDDFEEEIRQGLEQKLDAMLNRQIYSRYKTAPNEEEREQARQEYLDQRGVPQSYRWTTPPLGTVTGACHAPVAGRQGKALADTAPRIPVPIENPQILRWMAERIFKILCLPVGGSVEANSIAERLAVTPWILQSGYYLQATAEASAEAAFPPPRRAHDTLQPQDESIIVGYYTSAEVLPRKPPLSCEI